MNGWKSKELEEKEKKQQLQENAENVEAHASLELKYAQMVNRLTESPVICCTNIIHCHNIYNNYKIGCFMNVLKP